MGIEIPSWEVCPSFLLLGLLKGLPEDACSVFHLCLLLSLPSPQFPSPCVPIFTKEGVRDSPDLSRIDCVASLHPSPFPNIKLISGMRNRSSLAHSRFCGGFISISIISLKVFLAHCPWSSSCISVSLFLLPSGRMNQNNSAGRDLKVPAGRSGQNLPTGGPASHSNPRTLNSGHLQGKPWK